MRWVSEGGGSRDMLLVLEGVGGRVVELVEEGVVWEKGGRREERCAVGVGV